MTDHSELRTMIEEGKDKLEWYRQVDPAKLNTLKQLMMEDNYKENMSTLIKTIYEFAFLTYSGHSLTKHQSNQIPNFQTFHVDKLRTTV